MEALHAAASITVESTCHQGEGQMYPMVSFDGAVVKSLKRVG